MADDRMLLIKEQNAIKALIGKGMDNDQYHCTYIGDFQADEPRLFVAAIGYESDIDWKAYLSDDFSKYPLFDAINKEMDRIYKDLVTHMPFIMENEVVSIDAPKKFISLRINPKDDLLANSKLKAPYVLIYSQKDGMIIADAELGLNYLKNQSVEYFKIHGKRVEELLLRVTEEQIMKDITLPMLEGSNYIEEIRRRATWSFQIFRDVSGQYMMKIFDILTVDDLMEMDIDALSDEELRALLPLAKDLYNNIGCEEPDEEDFTSEAEYSDAYDEWEDGYGIAEGALDKICKKLGMGMDELLADGCNQDLR